MEATSVECRCGAVKLQISSKPVAQFYCHCADCQAVTGGAYVPLALYPSDTVTVIEGNPTTWTYKTLPRTRCSICGTILFGEPPGMGFRGVSGYLLPTGIFKPDFHVHCQHAAMPVQDDLPHFKGLPASFGGTDEMVSW
ncbi:MAG: aldehyde-activating protein [Cyanobacteria bacterium CRU_2_1]|nr:aldehyde-activating protein [Cyanobacteria bacterium RU_5_0]NJR58362.1 aldehyde-activating protein [Cyanobacteria bacterium CRU_2_1]